MIPTQALKEKSLKYKKTHGDGRFSYKIWVNPSDRKAFDFRDEKIDFEDFLDKKGFAVINKEL